MFSHILGILLVLAVASLSQATVFETQREVVATDCVRESYLQARYHLLTCPKSVPTIQAS